MNPRQHLVAIAYLAVSLVAGAWAGPIATDFTYCGRLQDGGRDANGRFDFRLTLYGAAGESRPIAETLARNDIVVSNGGFRLELDFGWAGLTNEPLWLEIGVRRTGAGQEYTVLRPRQSLTPLPVARFAAAAGGLLDASVTPSALAPGAVTGIHVQESAVTREKIADGHVVKSLNQLTDEVTLQGADPITISAQGGALTIGLRPSGGEVPRAVVVTKAGRATVDYPDLRSALVGVQNGETIEVFADQQVVAHRVYDGVHPDWAGLFLTNRSDITIRGFGLPKIRSTSYGDYLYLRDCTNVVVEGLAFDGLGSSPGEPWGYCMINFGGTNQRLTVRNCHFTNFGNQGVAHLWADRTSRDVTVEGCYFHNGGDTKEPWQGIDGSAIAGVGSGWRILNNVIENCLRGIEIEGPGPSSQSRILIAHNQLRDIWNEGICLFPTSWASSNYTDIIVEGNLVTGGAKRPEGVVVQTGISFQGGQRITIANNIVRDLPEAIMGIGLSSGMTDVRDALVTGNIVRNIGGRGIQLARLASNQLDACIVIGNQVQGCGDRGIIVSGTRHLVSGNAVHSSQGVGIEVYVETAQTDLNLVNNNLCSSNTYGLVVRAGTTNSLLSGNHCFGNELGQILVEAGPGISSGGDVNAGR